MKNYSFLKGITKTLIGGIIFLGPTMIGLLPNEIGNLTISSLLYLIYNYLKVSYSK